jgi:hypothetical protein
VDQSLNMRELNKIKMLQEHEGASRPFPELPENQHQKIWRYMDFAKFVDLLDKQALFFPRATLFNDAYEGSVSNETVRSRPEIIDKIILGFEKEIQNSLRKTMASKCEFQSLERRWARDWTYISCWHKNDHESAAMWSLYASSNQAVAIQSTFDRLYNCLEPRKVPPFGEPILGLVSYIDYEKEIIPQNFYLSEFFCKRKSFSHEEEIRAVIQELPLIPRELDKEGEVIISEEYIINDYKPIEGKSFEINVNNLIERIYVAPTAPKWFFDLTVKVLKKYGFNKEVRHSSLENNPVY